MWHELCDEVFTQGPAQHTIIEIIYYKSEFVPWNSTAYNIKNFFSYAKSPLKGFSPIPCDSRNQNFFEPTF